MESCVKTVRKVFELQKALAQENLRRFWSERRKTEEALARLPIVSFWQNPWAWLRHKALSIKWAYLKEKIASERAEILRYLSAQSGLEHRDYAPAIELLDKMRRGIPALLNNGPAMNLEDTSMPNATFYDLLGLRNELARLQAEEIWLEN